MTDIDLDALVKRVDALEKELFIVNRYIDTQLRDKYIPYQSDDPDAPYYKPVKEWLGPIPPTTEYRR